MARQQTVIGNEPSSALGVLFNPTARVFASIGLLLSALLRASPIAVDVVLVPTAGGGFQLRDMSDLAGFLGAAVIDDTITGVLPAGATKRYLFSGTGAGALNADPLALGDFIDRFSDGAYDGVTFAPWGVGRCLVISQTNGAVYDTAIAEADPYADPAFVTVSPSGDIWEG